MGTITTRYLVMVCLSTPGWGRLAFSKTKSVENQIYRRILNQRRYYSKDYVLKYCPIRILGRC